jgi:DNA replication and repair protein RecF
VPLIQLGISNFRCIAGAELELGAGNNLIVGPNASGKTSILEACGFLGRGRSFRGATTAAAIRHSNEAFVVTGRLAQAERTRSLGVQGGRDGLTAQVDGDRGVGAAGLAEALPLQVIDPEVHSLVAGGPDERRRYLDWVGFHVEQGYLETWRRFRRALRQRNAALREGALPPELRSWDHEFEQSAAALDRGRAAVVARVSGAMRETGNALLGGAVDIEYRRGWECMMEPLDFPITRLMDTSQKGRYLDEIYRHFTEQGVILTIPPDKRYGPAIGKLEKAGAA